MKWSSSSWPPGALLGGKNMATGQVQRSNRVLRYQPWWMIQNSFHCSLFMSQSFVPWTNSASLQTKWTAPGPLKPLWLKWKTKKKKYVYDTMYSTTRLWFNYHFFAFRNHSHFQGNQICSATSGWMLLKSGLGIGHGLMWDKDKTRLASFFPPICPSSRPCRQKRKQWRA